MNRTYFRFAGVAVAVALTAGACGKGKTTSGAPTSTTASPAQVEATSTALHAGAVQLRARLTTLLQASSYLTSAVAQLEVAQGPSAFGGAKPPAAATATTTSASSAAGGLTTTGGGGAATTQAGASATTTAAPSAVLSVAAAGQLGGARAALDQSSQDLAAAIGNVYPSVRDQFLAEWRAHIAAYDPFLRDVYQSDHAAQTADRAAVTATNAALGTLLNQVNPVFVASAVGDAVATTTTAQESALTAIGGRSATQYDSVRTAADSMVSLGEFLAHGIATKAATAYPGNLDSKAAFLLVAVETALQGHAYLAAQAGRTVAYGGDAVEAKAALDINNQAVSNVVLVGYGTRPGATFLEAWRRQSAGYVNAAGGSGATSDVQGGVEDASRLLTQLIPGLPGSVTDGLRTHATQQLAVASAQATHGPEFAALATAAGAMPGLGEQLAGAIAQQLASFYPGT